MLVNSKVVETYAFLPADQQQQTALMEKKPCGSTFLFKTW